MNTRLTDFNNHQLQLLLNALENYRQDVKAGRIRGRSPKDIKLDDDLNLLRTQLLTAIGIVGMKEREISN